jgi:hypothetical protein
MGIVYTGSLYDEINHTFPLSQRVVNGLTFPRRPVVQDGSSIPINPPPLILPHQRRPRRQVEQRHLRRQ